MQTTCQGDAAQVRHHAMLHATAQGAAAQKESIHEQGFFRGGEHHYAGEPVIAEAIAHSDHVALQAAARDLRFGAADAGGIHLVGALGKLGDARQLVRTHGRDLYYKLERGQKFFQRAGGAAGAGAVCLLGVEFGAAPVFGGHAGAVEGPHVAQKQRNLRGLGGQRQGQHLGRGGLRLVAFLGAIVHQDETIEPQFEFRGERCQALALTFPIDPAGRKIAQRERHFRMRGEHLFDILRVVLAAQGQQHSLAPARRHEFLQRAPGRIDGDALRPVFAADSSPQGFVAVERDGLERGIGNGVNLARDGGGQRHEELRSVGQMAEFLAVRIVDLGHGIQRGHFIRQDAVDRWQVARAFAENAQARFERGGVLGCGRADGQDERRRQAAGGRTDCLQQVARGSGGRDVFQTDQGHVETAAIAGEQARGIQQLLKELRVSGETDLIVETEFRRPKGQARLNGFGGKCCTDGDPAIVEGHEIPLYVWMARFRLK